MLRRIMNALIDAHSISSQGSPRSDIDRKSVEIDVLSRVLGIDTSVRDDFFNQNRIDSAFEHLFGRLDLPQNRIGEAQVMFWERIEAGRDFESALESMISSVLTDKRSLVPAAVRAFWKAHGMGHTPSQLYPFLSERSAVYRASFSAISAGNDKLPITQRLDAKRVATSAANSICGAVVAGTPFDTAVHRAFEGMFSETRPLSASTEHELAALHAMNAFWQSVN